MNTLTEPIPKPKRIKNKKIIQECRKSYSELSGLPAYGEPHHIISVGSGGPDIPENLIQLTGIEHTKAHGGQYSREFLFAIVARRENKTVEQIEEIIYRARRGDY